eukprot:TRINITY_DN63163_c0_g1_i1.p1 TRINITY_DN63163_c0_g1~~TRINITY_DN63163_c0_g1_i1.p1  ORF type:complete len:189 (+),score=44.22 TRINITY_DN63163_c0_g1_i1:89-655(+)
MPQVQMFRTLLTAGLVMVLQKIDIEKAGYMEHCRVLFFVAQACVIGGLLLIRSKIKAAKATGEKVHVPAVKSMGQEVKPAAVMTVPEYDLSKWQEQLQQLSIGAAISFGVHLKWGYVTPVCMQIVIAPMNLMDSPLAKVYLLGKAAKGDLLRPWAAPNPFGLQGQPQTAKERKTEARKEKAANAKKGK